MFDYLFDPEYRAAKNRYDDAKDKIRDLEKIKRDITDDSSSITWVNRHIGEIDECIENGAASIASKVSNKLQDLKEPYQNSDIALRNACDRIDSEIRRLEGIMRDAQDTMERIRNS